MRSPNKSVGTKTYVAIYSGQLAFTIFQANFKLDTAHRPVVMGYIEATSIENAWQQYRCQLSAQLGTNSSTCLAMMKNSVLQGVNTQFYEYEREA